MSLESFTAAAIALSVEEQRCDAFIESIERIVVGTCKKDLILSEYIKGFQAYAEAIKDCSTKITLVRLLG
jgi:hypothetical protein